jgi:hypothetical protein
MILTLHQVYTINTVGFIIIFIILFPKEVFITFNSTITDELYPYYSKNIKKIDNLPFICTHSHIPQLPFN